MSETGRRAGALWAFSAGLGVLFLGLRFGDDLGGVSTWTVLGGVGLFGGLVVQLLAWRSQEDERRRSAAAGGLLFQGIVLLGLGLYALSTDGAVVAFGLGDEAARRWQGVFGALWIIVFFAGYAPLLLLEFALRDMPRVVVPRRLRLAADTGLFLAFAFGLAFAVNFLASRHDTTWDMRYVKTTEVGASTRALVESLSEPLDIVLFFAPGSDVHQNLSPYFDALDGASDQLTVTTVDRAVDPARAKDLRVSSNGNIALTQGSQTERISIGTDMKSARRNLKKLDEKVLDKLMALTRKDRVAYVTSGHGEAHWTGDAEPERKMKGLKSVFEQLNYRVKDLSTQKGLGSEIPKDAGVIVIPGPTRDFLPEELDTLRRWLMDGGRLLVLFSTPEDEATLAGLADLLHVEFEPAILHNSRAHIARTHTDADRALIMTNRFSSHPSVTTLSKNSSRIGMLLPHTGSLAEKKDRPEGVKINQAVRTITGTWAETQGNHQFDSGAEAQKQHTVGIAWEHTPSGGRAAALATFDAVSDGYLGYRPNQVWLLDTVLWLTGDESLAGGTESEEDIRIEHSKGQDAVWFYGTSIGVPALFMGLGLFRVRRRKRK